MPQRGNGGEEYEIILTLSKRMSVLSMAAPRVERRAFPACSPSFAGQSSVSSAAAGPCKDISKAH